MKVVWNKVTWYSKFIALVIFILFPFIGFYFGIQVGEALQIIHDAPLVGAGSSAGNSYYSDVASWQTDGNNAGFAIAYPIDFSYQDNYSAIPSTDWRVDSNGIQGTTFFTLTIPSAFEPQTNFADAKLTVGSSRNATAVSQCLTTGATSSIMINGTAFTVFSSNGAGAGNYYQTTSYRAIHGGACWAVEYTIHSSQIANYPSSYNLHPFDQGAVTAVLDRIVGTFRFK